MKQERASKAKESNRNGVPALDEGMDGIRLLGPEGRENALRLARLAMGVVSPRDLNDPRFLRTSSGVEVVVDSQTFAAFTKLSG
jgi:hypothetical protein